MSLRPLLPLEHQCTYDPTYLDNMDPTLEQIQCQIYLASQALLLGTESRVTSMVLFHRYYARYVHQWLLYTLGDGNKIGDDSRKSKCPTYPTITGSSSDQQQQRMMIYRDPLHRQHLGNVASACIFVACKIENQPRRIRDVVNMSHMLNFQGAAAAAAAAACSSSDKSTTTAEYEYHRGLVSIVEASSPPLLDEKYWEMKQKLVSTEQTLLRFISFDVQVSHPHRILVLLLNHLFNHKNEEEVSPSSSSFRDMYTSLLQSAWRIINDTLFHPPCLRLPVITLVCASIQLAIQKYSNSVPNKHSKDKKLGLDTRQGYDESDDDNNKDNSSVMINPKGGHDMQNNVMIYEKKLHLIWKQSMSSTDNDNDDLDMAIQMVQQSCKIIHVSIENM